MVELSEAQKDFLKADGHQLLTGGPGSGKTTVSILKAAIIAREALKLDQRILFLSFARATVSRVFEAIEEERSITREEKQRIEVDTYHSFFWRILKSHGYLIGFPRRLTILTPANEAIALSAIRSDYKASSKLSEHERAEKHAREDAERIRLAADEGKVCFGLFAESVARLLHGSVKISHSSRLCIPTSSWMSSKIPVPTNGAWCKLWGQKALSLRSPIPNSASLNSLEPTQKG